MKKSFLLIASLLAAAPCTAQQHEHSQSDPDLQARGRIFMGVDQYSSTHVFDDLPDGGRIELQRDLEDSTGVAAIRGHLQQIAVAFKAGDFTTPALVHLKTVPGTTVMAALRQKIEWSYRPLARGGEVLIRSTDANAIRGIHQFLAFQREEHHARGKSSKPHAH